MSVEKGDPRSSYQNLESLVQAAIVDVVGASAEEYRDAVVGGNVQKAEAKARTFMEDIDRARKAIEGLALIEEF